MPRPTDRDDMPDAKKHPTDFDMLQQAIAERFDKLSKRLQQVAEYALAHPDDVALETIAVIAARANVPPSSLIRFSKALGFDGFTRMQRLFRDRLLSRSPSYDERIRRLSEVNDGNDQPLPMRMLNDVAAAGMEGLERLQSEAPLAKLDAAIEVLSEARPIYIVAQRRAFPVACYFSYLLNELGRPACLLDSLGGMLKQQSRAISEGAVLVAISFQPYAPDVLDVLEHGKALGVPLIAITDGPLSPLVRLADVSFELVESEAHGFRPLSAAMCLSLTLAVSLGHRVSAVDR